MKTILTVLFLMIAITARADTFAIDTSAICSDYQSKMSDIDATIKAFSDKKAELVDRQTASGCIEAPIDSVIAVPVKLDAELKPILKPIKEVIKDEKFVPVDINSGSGINW